MPVKIRLARHGRKARAIYHVVVADSRAPRDGRYIAKLGLYNPNTNPATIDLDFDKALDWLEKGAQPSDTARSILSREGVMLMKHLKGGVTKGAFTEEEAQKRFDAWKADKKSKNVAFEAKISKAKEDAEKERLALESKINEERVAELAKRKAAAVAEATAEEAEEEADEEGEAAAEEAAEGEESTTEA